MSKEESRRKKESGEEGKTETLLLKRQPPCILPSPEIPRTVLRCFLCGEGLYCLEQASVPLFELEPEKRLEMKQTDSWNNRKHLLGKEVREENDVKVGGLEDEEGVKVKH